MQPNQTDNNLIQGKLTKNTVLDLEKYKYKTLPLTGETSQATAAATATATIFTYLASMIRYF